MSRKFVSGAVPVSITPAGEGAPVGWPCGMQVSLSLEDRVLNKGNDGDRRAASPIFAEWWSEV